MEYKVIIKERKDYFEATSYYSRTIGSDPWVKLGKPEEGTLEKTILNSVLQIAHDRGKKRAGIIICIE